MIKIIKYSITLIIFAIIISLFTLYFYLIKGISIHNINYKNLNIGELYIKIDKKIIFKTNNIYYIDKKSSNNQNKINFKESTHILKQTLQYLSYFQEISINNLNINQDKIIKISLKNNYFIFNNEDISLKLSLTPERNRFLFNFKELYLKKYKISLNNIQGNFYSDLLHLYLNINTIYKNAQIKANFEISNQKINYQASIYNLSKNTLSIFKEKLKNLDDLSIYNIDIKGNEKELFTTITNSKLKFQNKHLIIPNIKIIFDIKSKALKLNTNLITIAFNNTEIKILNLIANFKNNEIKFLIPTIDLKNNNIQAQIYNNSINYNIDKCYIISSNKKAMIKYKNLKPITLNHLYNYYNVELNSLQTNIPNINIDNICVNNLNISLKNNKIDVTFQTDTLLSNKLNDILSTFNIKIPITQINGSNQINGKISYNLKNSKLHTNLKIDIKNSKLLLNKKPLLKINYSNLELSDTNLTLTNSDLDFNKSIVNLNYKIKKGLINLTKSYIDLDGKIKVLNLNNILNISNYPEKIYINLKGVDIFLKNLKTSIFIHKNIEVDIDKLSLFHKYIPYLKQYKLNEGNLKINIGKKIDIISKISDTNQTILYHNLQPLKKLDINSSIIGNKIYIYNNNLHIDIKKDKNISIIEGNFSNLDLNISQFINNKKETNQTKSTEKNPSTKIQTNIIGKDTTIYFNNLKLFSNILNIDYNSSDIAISSLYKDRNISIYSHKGILRIYGLKIGSKTLQDLTNSNVLNDPLITFFAMKNKNSKLLQGFIDIHKGYIKELKAFTNILAFINLIPSLVTFQPVGFTTKGFKIKDAHIEYIFYNKILYLRNIDIKGENLSFSGQGYIDLKKQIMKVNINVNLIVKLVNKIPIVNYILLGKDGGITIKLTVYGNLKNPKISKNTASNIIEAPIGIIKRTLLTPFRPFMKDNKQ